MEATLVYIHKNTAHDAVNNPVPLVNIFQRRSVDKKRLIALPAKTQGMIEQRLNGGIITIISQIRLASVSMATKIKLTNASVAVIALGLAN